ncbi:MAG: SDR family oxidoreductase [Anaerolineae bacterium]
MTDNATHTTHTMNVIFGTGPLGLAVMRALRKRNLPVRMVNRSGRRDGIPAEVEVVAADAYNPADVTRHTADARAVFQCAQPAYTEWQEKFPPLQASIIKGVSAHSGVKLIVGENLYMYGEVDGPMHENLPHAAQTKKGRVRAQMAEALIDAHEKGLIRTAVGRGSDFFGAGVMGSAVGERFFPPLLHGKNISFIGNPDMIHSYTYINDFGEGLVILSEHDTALGQAWHIPNAPAISTRAFVNIGNRQLGTNARISGLPKIAVRGIGLFIPEVREMVELAYEFDKPFVVDHSKFEKAFGNIATPLEDAIRETLAWFKAHEAVQA